MQRFKTMDIHMTSDEAEAAIWAFAVAYCKGNAYTPLYRIMAEQIENVAEHLLGWDATPGKMSRFDSKVRQIKRVGITYYELPPGAKWED